MCSHLNKMSVYTKVCVFSILGLQTNQNSFFGILLAGKLHVSVHLLSKWRHYTCRFFFGGGGDMYDQCTIGEQFIIMLVVSTIIISMNKTFLLISEKEPAFVTNMVIV